MILKDRKKWSLGKKILGFFSIQIVYENLHKYCVELNGVIGNVSPLPDETDVTIEKYAKFLVGIYSSSLHKWFFKQKGKNWAKIAIYLVLTRAAIHKLCTN